MYLLAKLISRQRQGWSSDKLLVDNNLLASCAVVLILYTQPRPLCAHMMQIMLYQAVLQ